MIHLSTAVFALSLPALVAAQTPQSQAPRASQVDGALRTVGRVAGQPDSSFSLEDRMRYWHVPGVSFAIIEDFRVVHAAGYGVMEFGGTARVDTTTLFQAGSISKPVFATGALRLVEQGTLSLDEDVNSKLDEWKLPDSPFNATEKVTLRRILTHTAGLTVWGFPGYSPDKPVPSVADVLDGKGNTAAVRNDTIPGARWLYSGGGYTIAQQLASDVAKEPFAALMQRLVLEPADMRRSTYANPLPASHAPRAASDHKRLDTPVPGRYHTYPEMAAAGLWTTAPDLARWAIALARAYNGQSGGVLAPAMARQMIQKQAATGPRGGNGFYGLGVAVAGDGDSISFSHGGRDEGFVAIFFMWPKLGKGYVALTNGVSGQLLNEIRRAFADTYGFGAPAPRIERQVVSADSASLAPLAGTYELSGPGGNIVTLDVSHRAGALSVYNHFGKRTFTLWPLGDDRFFDVTTGATMSFERDGAEPSSRGTRLRMSLQPNAPVARRK